MPETAAIALPEALRTAAQRREPGECVTVHLTHPPHGRVTLHGRREAVEALAEVIEAGEDGPPCRVAD